MSILSHELKTPLTSMKLQTELGMRTKELGLSPDKVAEKVISILRSNHAQIDRMVRLVDDLLDTARIGTGALRLEKEEVSRTLYIEANRGRTRWNDSREKRAWKGFHVHR